MLEPLTFAEIDQLEAGRETDALVATKVMELSSVTLFSHPSEPLVGWGFFDDEGLYGDDEWMPVPAYSTDIAAAWEVVERVLRDYDTTVEVLGRFIGDDPYRVTFMLDDCVYGWAPTLPLAICRAALKAVSVVQEEGRDA